MFGIMKSIDVSASGMTLQRQKMNVVSENIANAETTKTKNGEPYRRKRVAVTEFKDELSRARGPRGPRRGGMSNTNIPRIAGEEISVKGDNFRIIHDPDHPDANADGFVRMPDIDIVTEMVDMMAASRAYEANTMAIATAKEMARNALDI